MAKHIQDHDSPTCRESYEDPILVAPAKSGFLRTKIDNIDRNWLVDRFSLIVANLASGQVL